MRGMTAVPQPCNESGVGKKYEGKKKIQTKVVSGLFPLLQIVIPGKNKSPLWLDC